MSLFRAAQPRPADDGASAPHRHVTRAHLGHRGLLVAAVLAAGITASTVSPAAAAPSPAQPAAVGGGVVTSTVGASASTAALSYWTPERMRAAVSADVALPAPGSTPPTTGRKPTGPQGQAPATKPAAGATPSGPVKLSGVTANGYTYVSVPFSQYATYPNSTNGKIFFTNHGLNYVCSGSSVTAYSGSVQRSEVWTAGHCVSNTDRAHPGAWNSSAVFVPAYNGSYSDKAHYAPFGIFTASSYSTSYNWLTKGDFSVDLGAMTVGTSDTTGRTLAASVGTAGFMWNANASQTFDMFGYPAESPYSGKYLYHYRATTAGRDTSIGGSGQAPVWTNNPMTGGSSGGAWYVGWSGSGTGWINGHNDYKYNSQPGNMYSPYFDTLANTVRCFGASSC